MLKEGTIELRLTTALHSVGGRVYQVPGTAWLLVFPENCIGSFLAGFATQRRGDNSRSNEDACNGTGTAVERLLLTKPFMTDTVLLKSPTEEHQPNIAIVLYQQITMILLVFGVQCAGTGEHTRKRKRSHTPRKVRTKQKIEAL